MFIFFENILYQQQKIRIKVMKIQDNVFYIFFYMIKQIFGKKTKNKWDIPFVICNNV